MQGVITRFTNGATSMPSLINWFFFFHFFWSIFTVNQRTLNNAKIWLVTSFNNHVWARL